MADDQNVQDIIESNDSANQFAVAKIPAHTHNGTDSLQVDISSIARWVSTPDTGDIAYYNGSRWFPLSRGTTGFFLTTGTAPTWSTITFPAGPHFYFAKGSGAGTYIKTNTALAYIDSTNLSLTTGSFPSSTKLLLSWYLFASNNTSIGTAQWDIYDETNSTIAALIMSGSGPTSSSGVFGTGYYTPSTTPCVLKMRWKIGDNGTNSLINSATGPFLTFGLTSAGATGFDHGPYVPYFTVQSVQ